MKRRKGKIWFLIIIVVVVFFISVPIVNDAIARSVAKMIINTPLPERTEFMESVSAAGKLIGNGNGMQYYGAILVKSELTLDELSSYYGKYTDTELKLMVCEQADQRIEEIEHVDLEYETEMNLGMYYTVYSWGNYDGLFAELDIRGH